MQEDDRYLRFLLYAWLTLTPLAAVVLAVRGSVGGAKSTRNAIVACVCVSVLSALFGIAFSGGLPSPDRAWELVAFAIAGGLTSLTATLTWRSSGRMAGVVRVLLSFVGAALAQALLLLGLLFIALSRYG